MICDNCEMLQDNLSCVEADLETADEDIARLRAENAKLRKLLAVAVDYGNTKRGWISKARALLARTEESKR